MPFLDKQKATIYKKEWNKKYYFQNREKERERIQKRKDQIATWFEGYKSNLFCVFCRENTSVCLEFHHLDPSRKDFNLAIISSWGYGKKRILAEIAKCKVLCANCHKKVHAGILKLSDIVTTGSSNGRTMDSDSINLGSNPSPVTSS